MLKINAKRKQTVSHFPRHQTPLSCQCFLNVICGDIDYLTHTHTHDVDVHPLTHAASFQYCIHISTCSFNM